MAGRRMTAVILVPYQWRAHWRDLNQRGAWRGANVATVTFMGVMALIVQIILAALACKALAGGDRGIGLVLTGTGLSAVLIGWIALPLLVNSIAGGGVGLTVRRLVQFPLSTWQLFVSGAVGSLLQPVYWALLLASALALLPLAFLPQPLWGLTAGVVYVLAAAVFSWGLGLAAEAVMSSRRGREIALTLVAVVMFGWFPLSTGDLEHVGGRVTYTFRDYEVLLIDVDQQTGLLLTVGRWSPASVVQDAALGEAPGLRLSLLALALAAGLGLSVVSLRRLLGHPAEGIGGARTRQSTVANLPGIPPAVGVAAAKELRYLLRTLDALLGFAFGVIAAGWILLRPEEGPLVLILSMPVIVLNEMVMPLNIFGLDGRAIDRYRLLPLTGRQVLLGKNLAFLLVVAMEIALPVLAGFWRLGPLFTLAALCAGLAATVLMMVWGNQTSIRSAAPRAFFNFDSKEQAGGILSMLGVTAIWLVPLLVGVAGRMGGPALLLLAEALLLAAATGFYVFSLAGAARAFEERAEQMRAQLAG